MAKYFTIKEMTSSATAKRLGIDNTPNEEIKGHLEELMALLDKIREAWGSPIVITSGYRCPALNRAVGGSKTSSHMSGYAADMHPVNGLNKKFLRFVEKFLLDNNIPWDQVINEYPDKNGVPSWVHLGLYNSSHQQRRQSIIIK